MSGAFIHLSDCTHVGQVDLPNFGIEFFENDISWDFPQHVSHKVQGWMKKPLGHGYKIRNFPTHLRRCYNLLL